MVTPFPTLLPTGIESYQLVNSAALGAPRYTIYSEATANPQDIALLSYAGASQVEYSQSEDGYVVNSPTSFSLQLPKDYKIVVVDEQHIIGTRDNEFLIPAGSHTIQYDRGDSLVFLLSKFNHRYCLLQAICWTSNMKCEVFCSHMNHRAEELYP